MADDFGSSVGAGNLGTVAIGGSTNGALEAGADHDWFRLTLVAGQSYIFNMDRGSLGDPFLVLRDQNGVDIVGNDDISGSNFNSQIRFTATVSGTYYLDAFSSDGTDTGTYTVRAAIDPSPPASNDDYGAQAGSPTVGNLTVGSSINGNLETAGDRDWFAITLTAGASYTFRESSTVIDTKLFLRDGNGMLITGNDDDPAGGSNSLINYTATTTGVYYLEANTFDAGQPAGIGAYTVSAAVNGNPPPPPTDDYGSQVGANNLGSVTAGSSSIGLINYGGDHDWFAVTLSVGSSYRIRQEAGTLADPRFTLRNSIGGALTGDDDSGGGQNAQVDFTATSSGTYYIDANGADGTDTGTYTVRVTVLYGAPVIVNNTGSTAAEGGADTITASELSTTDPDTAASAIIYTLTSLATNGALTRNGTALALNGTFTQADINSNLIAYNHNGSETTSGSFGFSVSDGTTTFTGRTFAIAVTPVDDAPTATNLSAAQTYVEDTTLNLTDIVTSDVDSGTLTATLTLSNTAAGSLTTGTSGAVTSTYNAGTGVWTASGAIINVNALLSTVSFVPTANFNGNFTIATSVSDGVAPAITGSKAITGTAVNDAPTVTVTGSDFTFTEGDAPHAFVSTATVVDPEGNYAGGTLTLTTTGSGNGDALTILGTDITVMTADGVTGTIRYQGVEFATFSLASGSPFATFENNATATMVEALIKAIGYANSDDNPGSSTRHVTVTLTDGAGGSTSASSFTSNITVVPINDSPVLDASRSPVLSSELEDAGAPVGAVGTLVSALVDYAVPAGQVDNVGDPDGPSLGLAITGADTANGTWFYSLNGGTNWSALGSVSDASARLLLADADNRVYFQPGANYNGTVVSALTFRAWDGSSGTDGGNASAATNGGATAFSSATDTIALTVTAVDDPAVARNDAVSTAENAVVTGNVLSDNGSGADSDVDGPALAVASVNGSAGNVGTQIVLASGAKLTVNADGTYSYDPNGQFNTLTNPSGGESGAVNTSATDSFTYALAGGGSATVTVTVNGVAGPGDWLAGNAGANTITGTGGDDLFLLQQGGSDAASGGGGNDGFYLGGALDAADSLDGGPGTNDQLGLQGNYSGGLVLGAGNLTNIEALVLLSGSDARFGDTSGTLYSYNLTTVDANVGTGQTLTVNWNTLRVGENVTFNGSAELDGKFLTYGGAGNDHITGGQQDDGFFFAGGKFGSGDIVDGQGGSNDQLGLQGDYSGGNAIHFGAGQLVSMEAIVLLSGADTRFNAGGSTFSYDLTMDNGNLAGGATLTVNANTLRANETLSFNGAAELDGSFKVYGGAGADGITGGAQGDTLYGGAGLDTLTGGLGNDTFLYMSAADSTAAAPDAIQDFTLGDLIDLSHIDAIAGGSDDPFAFIGSAAFGHHAGELRAEDQGAGFYLVQGDIDGDGTADLQILAFLSDNATHTLGAGDFVL